MVTGAAEGEGGCPADPAGCACDEDDLVYPFHLVVSLSYDFALFKQSSNLFEFGT